MSLDYRGYTVLTTYIPTKWKAWKIGRDLTSITRELGLVPLHDPKHRHQGNAAWSSKKLCAYVRNKPLTNQRATGWHQDGDLVAGSQMDNCLCLWSNTTPTELSFCGNIVQPEPFELIIFNNLSCFHRRPPKVPFDRWHFRQRVENPNENYYELFPISDV